MFHIAQVNIGRMVAPLDSPTMAGFVGQLAAINAIADSTAGFIWRLQTPTGDATSIRVFDDDRMMINMSVWESIEALHEFSYKTSHAGVMSQRANWFERLTTPYMALWWIPVGTVPTPEDGKARLDHLEKHGPTAHAFTFKTRFPMPTSDSATGKDNT